MPMHKRRTWVVHPAESAEWLAEKLVGHSWCSCAGWSLGGYLFLNDQTSEDGAFEVAIVKLPRFEGDIWYQVESVTFGWLSSPAVLMQHWRETGHRTTPEQLALGHISRAVSGECDPSRHGSVAWKIDPPSIETPEQHGRCPLCA
jgi:hypothetical protein